MLCMHPETEGLHKKDLNGEVPGVWAPVNRVMKRPTDPLQAELCDLVHEKHHHEVS